MNIAGEFQQLLPQSPLQIGTVVTHNFDGTSTIELIGGGTLVVRGQGVAVGLNAYVQHGQIQGEAPDLPVFEIEV